MIHCATCENRPHLLHLNLDPTPVDTRLPFVDHILGQLILDRCGAYAFARRIKAFGTPRDAVRAEANFDVSPTPFPVPFHRRAFSSVSLSNLCRNLAASLTFRIEHLAELTASALRHVSRFSPATLGRGSPKIFAREIRERSRKWTNGSAVIDSASPR